jgi:hypothetical protein
VKGVGRGGTDRRSKTRESTLTEFKQFVSSESIDRKRGPRPSLPPIFSAAWKKISTAFESNTSKVRENNKIPARKKHGLAP